MIRSNLMFVCALTLASLYSMGLSAQTKIWGAGASAGQAEGEFQTVFTQTGSMGSYSATTWTALSVFENQSATTTTVMPGAAYWKRSLLGYSQGFYAAPAGQTPPPLPSPTQTNGVAIFDSGFMDNNGTSTTGVGTSPAAHRGELISPRIDLTGYMDTALVVQFYSDYRDFQTTEFSVSMSVDDGLTWSAASDYRVLQSASTPGMVRVLMPNTTASVALLTHCRIRFVAETNYYYAMIDDVTLESAPAYDIGFGNADFSSTSIIGSGDFAKIGNNRYYPYTNLDASNIKEWFWGGKVVNYGGKTLLPEDTARMHVVIDYYDAVTNQPTFDVYRDTMDIDTLVAGNQTGTAYIEYLRDINFLFTHKEGTYRVRYWLDHKNDDGSTANDTLRHTFSITGSGSSYLSKARRAASDGRVFASRGIFPGGTTFSAFEYGSVYYFPKGLTNNLSIDSIEFRYYVPNGYSGNAAQTLFVNVARLVDGGGATASDGLLDSDELIPVGVALASISGIGTTGVTQGNYGLATVSGLVDPGTGGAITPLQDHGFYYISVLQNPGAIGGGGTFNANTALWIGADEYNYYMNRAMTRPDTIINPSPSMNTDAAGSVSWFADGFNGGFVPSIGVHLPPLVLSATTIVTEEEDAQMSLFPNPTSTQLNINVKFEEARDVQYILTDVSGRVISVFNSTNVTEETQTINVEQFATGVYFLTARTDEGTTTQRFIKK